MNIGEKIKMKRGELNLTQEALAKRLNVSRSTISSWEVGRNYPDLEMIVKISDVLLISLDNLLREDEKMVKMLDKKIKNNKKYKWVIGVLMILIIVPIGLETHYRKNNQHYLENVSRWEKDAMPRSEGMYSYKENGITYSTYIFDKRAILLPILDKKPWLIGEYDKSKLMVTVYSKNHVKTLINKERDKSVDFIADIQINENGEMVSSKKELSKETKNKTNQYLKEHQSEYQTLYRKSVEKWIELTRK